MTGKGALFFKNTDDVKALTYPVLAHRLILNPESRLRRVTVDSIIKDMLGEVPVPAGGRSAKG